MNTPYLEPEVRETLRLLGPGEKLELAASYVRAGRFEVAQVAAQSAIDDLTVLGLWKQMAR